MLCVVEDAHWLDPATADALLFCARRLGADRVLLVFSARDATATPFHPDGIDELVLAGLDPDAARALLEQRAGAAPAPEVADRLVVETGGNPLALLELPTELSADQLGGAAPLPTQLHLSTRVERAFLDRSRRCRHRCSPLLLLAAADDTGDLAVIRAAASSSRGGRAGSRGRGRVRAAGPRRRRRAGAASAGALGPLPGRHRRPAPKRSSGTGRGAGRGRGRRPGDVAPRRRRGRTRPGRRRGPPGRRGPRRASRRLRLGAGRVRTCGSVDHGHTAAGRADARGSPQRLGLRADRPLARAAGRRPPARLRPGAARRHRPAPGPDRGQPRLGGRRDTGSSPRPHTPSTRSTRPMPWRWRSSPPSCAPTAPTAAPPWRPATSTSSVADRRPAAHRVPQADARRDDPRRRRRLGGSRDRAGPRPGGR